MRPARARHGHPVVADAVTAVAGAAMAEAVVGTVVVAATVASEEATKVRHKLSRVGLGRAGFEPAKA